VLRNRLTLGRVDLDVLDLQEDAPDDEQVLVVVVVGGLRVVDGVGIEPTTLGLKVHPGSWQTATTNYLRYGKAANRRFSEGFGLALRDSFSWNLYAHSYAHGLRRRLEGQLALVLPGHFDREEGVGLELAGGT